MAGAPFGRKRRKTEARGVIPAGTYIFREGDEATAMYIIQEGLVQIVRARGGEERELARLEPGDFFGTMSLLEHLPRSACARALTDCRLLRVEEAAFEDMLASNAEIAGRMLRTFSRRLREATGGSGSA